MSVYCQQHQSFILILSRTAIRFAVFAWLLLITTICTISFIQMFYIFRGIYPKGVRRWPFDRTSSTNFVIGHLKSSITYMFAVSHGIQGHKSLTADIKIPSYGTWISLHIQLYYNLKIICTRSQRSLEIAVVCRKDRYTWCLVSASRYSFPLFLRLDYNTNDNFL